MEILTIPYSNDNYCYAFRAESEQEVAVVDPGDGEAILEFLKGEDLAASAILCTHHHPDHVGGVSLIKERFDCEVYAFEGNSKKIPQVTEGLADGQSFTCAGVELKGLHVPGHTLNDMAFYIPSERVLFSGDTLFSLGCGRVFEGTFEQMYQSLQTLKKLPPETQVFFGHEYTENNGFFAIKAGFGNDEIDRRLMRVSEIGVSVPTTIGWEKENNPFLTANSAEEFAKIRRAKDNS
jgi:hydroxyacylglutathione hydrolase